MKPKELLRHPFTDVDSRSHAVIENRIKKLFTVDMKLKDVGADAAARSDAKTPAVWTLHFIGGRIVVDLRIGRARHLLGEFDVGSMPDAARRNTVVDKLREEGVIDASEVAAFRRAHPDKTRLAELRAAMAEKLRAIEALKNDLLRLKTELAAQGG